MPRNIFNSVPLKKIKRNPFNLSFINDYTADYGYLYPVITQDAYAGEIYRISLESFIRSQPLRAPAFTESNQSYHIFFVPYRLVYEDWSKFIVRGDDAVTPYDKPYYPYEYLDTLTSDLYSSGSLLDYLNFPTANDATTAQDWHTVFNAHMEADPPVYTKIDLLPVNAYNLIFNEYYRDETLYPEVYIMDQSGFIANRDGYIEYAQDLSEDGYDPLIGFPFILRKRAWRKDYFTSALPFAQKGSPISLMGTVNPADGQSRVNVQFMLQNWQVGDPSSWFLSLKTTTPTFTGWNLQGDSITQSSGVNLEQTTHHHSSISLNSSYSRPAFAYIDLPEFQSTIMTISDLRVGLALQQWFELDARTGSSRYFEYLLGHFGVRDRDSRLQRPEYIGGFSHAIQVSEVEQNSETTQGSPQGNLAGRGLGYAVNGSLTYRCPEPGFIMCLSSLRPRAYYYQGMPRKYQRWDSFDYYDPLFDHIGEQSIKRSELYFDPVTQPFSEEDMDFGYTPYFSDRRTHLNELHGGFRSDLSYWVSPRKITSNDKLTYDFISVDGYAQSLYEMFSFTGNNNATSPHFLVHLKVHMSMISPMSKYAVPGL